MIRSIHAGGTNMLVAGLGDHGITHIGEAVFVRPEADTTVEVLKGYRTHRFPRVPTVAMREGETILALVYRGDAENLARWVIGDCAQEVASYLRECGLNKRASVLLAHFAG